MQPGMLGTRVPVIVNLLAEISKESKMREHFTKKGAVNFNFDRVNF